MLLCDNCDSGFHLRCVELAAVPPGDWYCDGCSTVIESQRWLRKKGLLHSSNWISVDALDFGAGDFVIVVYPKLGASKVQLYLAQVIRIGSNLQLGSDPSEQVVELEHWPEVKFPLFQKPGARGQPARVWQESQLFWPLLARVAQPQLYRELVTLGRPADQKYELLPADRVRVLQSLVPKYTS